MNTKANPITSRTVVFVLACEERDWGSLNIDGYYAFTTEEKAKAFATNKHGGRTGPIQSYYVNYDYIGRHECTQQFFNIVELAPQGFRCVDRMEELMEKPKVLTATATPAHTGADPGKDMGISLQISKKLDAANLAVLDMCHFSSTSLLITRINVPMKYRGQGHAHDLLVQAIDMVDKLDLGLRLEVQPSDGLSYAKLVAWYERHGFDLVAGDQHKMYRRRSSIRVDNKS